MQWALSNTYMTDITQNNANVLLIGCFFRWTFTTSSFRASETGITIAIDYLPNPNNTRLIFVPEWPYR